MTLGAFLLPTVKTIIKKDITYKLWAEFKE